MAAKANAPRIVPFGDGALLVVLGDEISAALSRRSHALAAQLHRATEGERGWGRPVPAYASVLLPYDQLELSETEATDRLDRLLRGSRSSRLEQPKATEHPAIEVPVRYGGEDGPDLAAVAERLNLSTQDVVKLHSGREYDVLMLGFAPGFAYLGLLAASLSLPRRDTPRTRVPVGSVAIAGRQTAVYPSQTAGGWHLIGRTELEMWDPARDEPALLRPGNRVRFRAVAG